MQSSQRSRSGSADSTAGTSRRTFLKTSATVAVAAAGVGATMGSGAADTDQIMELDLRDGVPPVSDAPQGEDVVHFYVHGYSGSSESVSQAETYQQTLRDVGNTETVTAVTWDDSGWASTAEASARDQGGVFADWMAQYLDQNPGTTIRVLGHSMGGIVTYEMLSSTNGRFRIANADTIGSYEVSDSPCEGTEFHQPIEDVAKSVGNYYSTNDGIARLGNGPAECSSGALPSNYADVDCSSSVSGHTDYKQSQGCVQKIADNFVAGVDRGSDGGDGGDSTAPTAPSNLSSPSHGETSVDLDWDASSDDGGSGLDHYNVYVDGSKNQEVAAGTTAATVSNLSSDTSYDFSVTAVDGAGNESSSSNTISVTTDSSSDGGWW
jgi:pimeloyl-ACP methyl ester carboxylesterase